MNRKFLLLAAFFIIALAQLVVPVRMISEQAAFAQSGKEFQFKIKHKSGGNFERGNTSSSIQGKYLMLNFEIARYKADSKPDLDFRNPVFISLIKDSLGFARVGQVAQRRPETGPDWIKGRAFPNRKDSSLLQLSFPFRNYYLEDSDTRLIDSAITRRLLDTTSLIYLNVIIREDRFLIKDLVIDSLSFKEFVKKAKSNQPPKY